MMREREILNSYGFTEDLFHECKREEFFCARVIGVHHSDYELASRFGIISAKLPGRWRREKNPIHFPAVGDWVLFEKKSDRFLIQEILSRRNILKRKKRHWVYPKPIAANLDGVILVQAFGQDINFRRLQRVFTLLLAQNLPVYFIFNKQDLVSEKEINEIQSQMDALGIDTNKYVFFTSTKTGKGIDKFADILLPKKTYTLIGSSGVGKSSLVNSLFKKEIFNTRETMKTGKGKHTTTSRKLILLPNEALLIDTPGTRDFSIEEYIEEMGDEAFPLIHKYAQQCKFRDCMHRSEPGCAVREAVEREEIERAVYDDYLHFIQYAIKNSPKQKR